jgi:hypothetical protein
MSHAFTIQGRRFGIGVWNSSAPLGARARLAPPLSLRAGIAHGRPRGSCVAAHIAARAVR